MCVYARIFVVIVQIVTIYMFFWPDPLLESQERSIHNNSDTTLSAFDLKLFASQQWQKPEELHHLQQPFSIV